MLRNDTSVQLIFKQVAEAFNCMNSRKAFHHKFLEEGVDPMEFVETGSNLYYFI